VIVSADGLILTNNHVVQDADEVLVRLGDGREFKATDIKTDPMSDLAVLRIKDAGMLRSAKLGESDKLAIGDWVIAIGSPFNLEATVSAGIISGKGRGISQIRRGSLIQTDAAINPGNSGGPLVNLDGEVVGINTAIASRSGGNQGIGFAIPIDRAKWVSRELLEHGAVRRAFLGIRISELLPDEAKRLGRPARSGVHVVMVLPDGPSAIAGLKVDDVIVDFAGIVVRRPRDLQDAVEQKPLESKQEVKVYRDGMITTLQVTLGALPVEAQP
jgi:serine protease Do